MFRCGHRAAQAYINWQINGTQVQNFTEFKLGPSSDGSGGIVHTLTIPARPEYSGTEVVCLAFFLDGSPTEETPPVTLTVTPDVPSNYVASDAGSACYSFEVIESTAPSIEMPTTTQVCKFGFSFFFS